MSPSGQLDGFPPKRSFLRLPVPIDVERLLLDYHTIPRQAWSSTHWDTHCSSNMVLLRGGTEGTQDDFTSASTEEHEVLRGLPYLGELLGHEGPFGEVKYAFILRMKPLGVARPHVDSNPAWFDPFRVHVPITTNDGAFLLSEGRAKHLCVGEVWTFDNQSTHAVVNGDAVRAHLIFDVTPGPVLRSLLAGAEHDPGEEDRERWRSAGLPDTQPTQPYASSEPLSLHEKEALGIPADSFASRVVKVHVLARALHADLRVGDVICSVNGVEECVVARTATDYIQVRHRPGETIVLQLVRAGRPVSVRLRLLDVRPFARAAGVHRSVRQGTRKLVHGSRANAGAQARP